MTAAVSPPPPVRIELIELRLLRLPLVHHFETSFGRITEREFVLVKLAGDGAVGVGRVVADVRTVLQQRDDRDGLAHRRAIPRAGRCWRTPSSTRARSSTRWHSCAAIAWPRPRSRWPRGRSTPPAAASRFRRCSAARARPIPSGVSIGIQDSLDELVERVGRERAAGYQRVKIKIKPGWDVDAGGADSRGAWSDSADGRRQRRVPPGDADRLAELDRFDLMMIEQPLDYDDLRAACGAAASPAHADLPGRIHHSARPRRRSHRPRRLPDHQHQARPARRLQPVDRACTISRALRGLPVWHGGMLESGIGRAHNLHLVVAPQLLAAWRHCRQPAVLRPGSDRAADRGRRRRDDRRAGRARPRREHRRGPRSRAPRRCTHDGGASRESRLAARRGAGAVACASCRAAGAGRGGAGPARQAAGRDPPARGRAGASRPGAAARTGGAGATPART